MSVQPDFATTPRSRRLPLLDLVLLGAGSLALLFSAWTAWRAREEAVFAVGRLAAVEREVEQQSARLRALTTPAVARPVPSRILAAIARVLPSEARLEGLTIDFPHGVALQLQVEARDAAAWDRMLDRLERSAEFAEVETGPETRDGAVRSQVRARWAGEDR